MCRVFAVLVFVSVLGCRESMAPELPAPLEQDPLSGKLPAVSLVHLISNSRLFDGVDLGVVALVGVAQGKEALFLHRLDYENSVLANSVRLELTEEMRSRFKPPCYVEVEGMFIIDPVAETGQVGRLQVARIAPWFLAKDPKECKR